MTNPRAEIMTVNEDAYILDAIKSARKIQEFLWGKSNGAWGLRRWKEMLYKRMHKIDQIDISHPCAIVELRKRILQNAALSIALLTILSNDKYNKDFMEN